MNRIQDNVLARPERRLLNWLCALLPTFITPDRLTIIGFLGALLVLAGGALSNLQPTYLWLANFGLFVNWFGDSLDGSLARYRNITRPRYGYFLDHSVDGLNNFCIMVGLGLTGSVRLSIALLALCGYFILSICVFLRCQALKELQLSFVFLGPTELRIVLFGMFTGMFFNPRAGLVIAGRALTIYEIVLLFGAIVFVAIFVWLLLKTAKHLRVEDRG